jgi:hypothetical protein
MITYYKMHTMSYLVGFNEPSRGEIQVKKAGGDFFSCCTIRFESIQQYLKKNGVVPKDVHSEFLFSWYKPLTQSKDITFDYFADYNKITSDVATNADIVQKYFSPSPSIQLIIDELRNKYNIDELKVSCALLYYKGNRSRISYDELIGKAKRIQAANKDIIFIIQSDTSEFLELANETFPGSTIFKNEIRFISENCKESIETVDRENNLEFSKNLLATFYIVSSSCDLFVCDVPIHHEIWLELFKYC